MSDGKTFSLMLKLFLVVNEDGFFLSHRKDVALKAHEAGFDVSVVCKDTGRRAEIEALGLRMIPFPINPTGENIFEELRTFCFLLRLYRNEKPKIVHHVGLKSILWGGLSARLSHVHGVVNAVSGLGTIFNGDKLSLKARVILYVIRFASSRKNIVTIFQNHEDEALFFRYGICSSENSVFIKGAGVDLSEYCFSPEP